MLTPSNSRRLPPYALAFAWLLSAFLSTAPAFGQARARRTAPPEPRPKIVVPTGEPTTAENIHLPTEREIRLGREIAYEIEKRYTILTKGPEYDRVQRIARHVRVAAQYDDVIQDYLRTYKLPKKKKHDKSRRLPFEFSFKVIKDDKIVNAVSLAGGPIYITTGLLNEAGSDDEVAAVMSHEVAHIAYHHVVHMVSKGKKASKNMLWALLAAVLVGVGGGGGDSAAAAAQILYGVQLINVAAMSGFSRELETEADRAGVIILRHTPYNPAAMVTFMKRLARQHKLRGNPDGGIFQTHPYPNKRVKAIYRELAKWNIPVDPGIERQVAGRFQIDYRESQVNGMPTGDILLNGTLLFRCAAGQGRMTARERAKSVAEALRLAFRDSVTFGDVRLAPDKNAVLIRGARLIEPLPGDVAANGAPASEQAMRAYNAIMRSLWKEKLENRF